MKAYITGIGGQDGSFLAELLLEKGYEVFGVVRRSSCSNLDRLLKVIDNPGLKLVFGDLTDSAFISRTVAEFKPDEVYNLGCQSHVRLSFDAPSYCTDTIVSGTLNLLEALRQHCPEARFYQASSSEMFGKVLEPSQRETTPFNPRSPYGCAKVCAHFQTINYRESYGLHASCGILFNHESPRRGETFVTRKITKAIAEIVKGTRKTLALGNLDAKRDWGLASEYVEAMWRMLQQGRPDDYVVATGETHTVREFVEEAFKIVGRDWNDYVTFDPSLLRPAEVDLLLGDPTKAQMRLGWKPKTTFKQLVEIMVKADLEKHE